MRDDVRVAPRCRPRVGAAVERGDEMFGERSDAHGQVPARVIEQRRAEVAHLPVGQQANEFAVALERPREMLRKQSTGNCMTCHTAQGAQGAPGRILAP